jgi:hypothetical protein
VKALRGFIQGYNAQTVTNEQHVVIAAEVMTAASAFGHLEPDAGSRPMTPRPTRRPAAELPSR